MAQRKFIWEFIINLALAYSLLIIIFFLPYIYIRNLFSKTNFWILVVYLAIAFSYLCLWIKDKWGFIKDEFKR